MVGQTTEEASLFPQSLEIWQRDPPLLGRDAGPDIAGEDQFALFVISDPD
jgi:hypothetical protein